MAARRTRRRRTRRPSVRSILIGALVVLLAGFGVWLVGFSSVLAVRSVTVAGTQVLSEDEVLEIAQVPVGEPLARLSTDRIGGRVAELPPVRSVQVNRQWPHTVHIEVVERTARLVAHNGSDYVLVDDTGLGYTDVPEPPEGLVIARNVPEAEWADAAVVVRALPDTAAARAESLTTRGPDAIVIHLTEGVLVEWGSAENSADKALVLSSLMTAVPDARVYNVSAPNHPTTR